LSLFDVKVFLESLFKLFLDQMQLKNVDTMKKLFYPFHCMAVIWLMEYKGDSIRAEFA